MTERNNPRIIITTHALQRAQERTTIPNYSYLIKAVALAIKKNQTTTFLEKKYLEDVQKGKATAFLLGNSIFIVQQKKTVAVLITVLKKPQNLLGRFSKNLV